MAVATTYRAFLPIYGVNFRKRIKFRKWHLKVKSGRKLRAQDAAQWDQQYCSGLGQVLAQEVTSQQFALLSG